MVYHIVLDCVLLQPNSEGVEIMSRQNFYLKKAVTLFFTSASLNCKPYVCGLGDF